MRCSFPDPTSSLKIWLRPSVPFALEALPVLLGNHGNFLPLLDLVCYPNGMIRRFVLWALMFILGISLARHAGADTYLLNTGETLEGQPISFTEQGVS